MNIRFSNIILFFTLLFFLFSCTKKIAKDPEIPFNDQSLLDSARTSSYHFYKNKSDTFYSGAHGPHGTFKLRFNAIAFAALTDTGRLPKKAKFPEGSFIVKDVYKNGSLYLYAYMYKHTGKWLWGEVEPGGSFQYKAKDGDKVCLPCHTQTGNRDNALVFYFY
jgi:hypothetical protein